jgi:hypothetical protein
VAVGVAKVLGISSSNPAGCRLELISTDRFSYAAQPSRQDLDSAQMEVALRWLPSHGWNIGWFGGRDRALLVLAQVGVPYRRIAALPAGGITLTDCPGGSRRPGDGRRLRPFMIGVSSASDGRCGGFIAFDVVTSLRVDFGGPAGNG